MLEDAGTTNPKFMTNSRFFCNFANAPKIVRKIKFTAKVTVSQFATHLYTIN
jgi:hypothetical protein